MPIHLKNLLTLSSIPGVRIIPPLLNYYQGVKTVAELERQLAARFLLPFGLRTPDFRQWEGGRQ